jgi:coenzyme F420-reducing hydrogenase delta subunit
LAVFGWFGFDRHGGCSEDGAEVMDGDALVEDIGGHDVKLNLKMVKVDCSWKMEERWSRAALNYGGASMRVVAGKAAREVGFILHESKRKRKSKKLKSKTKINKYINIYK